MPSASGPNQTFEVPVLYQDVRQAEAFNQICDAIENLNRVVDDVFGGIKERIASEKQRMDDISTRLAVAKAKVQFIEANYRTKATTVLSSNKYPSSGIVSDFKPLFASKPLVQIKRANYHLSDHPHNTSKTTHDPLSNIYLPKEESILDSKDFKEAEEEGLGRLPQHLPSVSSLLLFNTDYNPYRVYATIDNLLGVDPTEPDEEKKESLADAPITVIQGEELHQYGKAEYTFKPTLDDVPVLNFPSTLTALDSVAGDIQWSGGLDLPANFDPIAPSAHLLNLPEVQLDPGMDTPPPPLSNNSSNAPPPPSNDVPPPPPLNNGPPPPPALDGPPPPPPPGPPPPGPPPPPTNVPKAVANPDGGRSALLAALQNPENKKKLKSSKDDKGRKRKKGGNNPAPAPVGGDIFAALRNALDLRKKSLAGGIDRIAKKKTNDDVLDDEPEDEDDIGLPEI